MDPLIQLYKNQLSLSKAHFIRIDHKDAMVATVFKIVQPNSEESILKI